MTRIIKDDTLVAQWEHLLTDKKYLKPELETAKTNNLFILDFEKVDKANPELGELLLEHPIKALGNLEYALENQELKDYQIEITGLHPIAEKNIAELRTDDLNKLKSIEGIILQVTSVNPRLLVGAFQCLKCGAIIRIEQNEEYITEPAECYEDQGGCGRVANFRLLTTLSKYIDFQKMLITNPYYEPHRRELEIHCYKNHCNKVLPGETITINGLYSINQQKKQLTQDTYFHTYGFETPYSKNLEFTTEELKQAQQLAASDKLWPTLIKSFAPSIYGYTIHKESLLLQQSNGVWYDLPDGTTKRGTVHILLAGDPGTVKSTLMQASATIAPIFTKASGRGATVAGITAGAVKDPLGEGQWILQAGALVRSNNGICYLDEFDKLPKEVQGCLHGPMEQGVVEQSKMGSVNQSLAARTSILGSMNPKMGRFDSYVKYIDQIDIEAALLSRYDLIYAITDTPEPETDKKIVQHIHKTIYKGAEDSSKDILTPDFLRKYIHYAHRFKPIIPEEINNKIIDWFLECRNIEEYHINVRHYEAIRRLAEAGAKIRLATTVNNEDVERAIRLFNHSLDTLGVKDIDSILTGVTTKEKRILNAVEGVLPCYWNDILGYGYKESDIQVLIDKGFLFEGKDSRIYVSEVSQ